MALAGKGVLAIWNGIAPEAEDDFLHWHVKEHIPERVAVPGFRKARRYVGMESWPAYFNFYEVDDWQVLQSKSYLDRLNAPSPWTQRVVRHFRDTFRTPCMVAATDGCGDGSVISTFRLRTTRERTALIAVMQTEVMALARTNPTIVGVHLLEGQTPPGHGQTAEKALRGQPDGHADWILLVEGVDEAALRRLVSGAPFRNALDQAGAVFDTERDSGVYRLQYTLTEAQLPLHSSGQSHGA